MKRLLLALLLIPALAFAQTDHDMTDTDVITCAAIESSGTTYIEALADGSWIWVDVVNNCDCTIQVRQDDETNTPATLIGGGTTEIIKAGEYGAYISGSISVRKLSGETCASGPSVWTKAGYFGDGL